MAHAADIIARFGAVEDDQRYTRLVELFTDDATYYDPFFGAQTGKAKIQTFMEHMEEMVPASGAYFGEWEVMAGTTVGWAKWTMYMKTPDGEKGIDGQSIYRLRDDGDGLKVCFVSDYLDSAAYRKLGRERVPEMAAPAKLSKNTTQQGSGYDVIKTFWKMQDTRQYGHLAGLFTDDAVFTDQVYGRFEGIEAITKYMQRMDTEMPEGGVTFELEDCAGDETVGWSQWTCNVPGGSFPGWTLHTFRDGKFTLDSDYFDVALARKYRPKG
jgi:ketosteroid isomerase-like protein